MRTSGTPSAATFSDAGTSISSRSTGKSAGRITRSRVIAFFTGGATETSLVCSMNSTSGDPNRCN
jgi:hypothetical protein